MMAAALFIAVAIAVVFPGPLQRITPAAGRPRDGPDKKDCVLGGGVRIRLDRVLGRWGVIDAEKRWDHYLIDIAADIDLFAACSAAGLNPATAAEVVSKATRDPLRERWQAVASLLSIGADPERAWRPVAGLPGLGELARVAANAHTAGAKVAESAGRVSARLRQRVADQATVAGERAGVLIALPLTFCFLPAFFLLGLAPVVLGLAGEVFG